MDKNPKIHLINGVAKDAKGKPVLTIDADNCNCGFDLCNCAWIFTDLNDGSKHVQYYFDGEFLIVTFEQWEDMVESGDFNPD